MSDDAEQHALREALKRIAVALKQGDLPFALGGGYAAWARGGPEPEHDVDFVVREDDSKQAQKILTEAGLRVDQPPEDWLFKVYSDDAMVDVIFRMGNNPVGQEVMGRVSDIEVLSVLMPVLSATDVLSSKLIALDEHKCDLANVLPVARALREQVDWERLRTDAQSNDFALAALFLMDRLHISD